MTFERPVVRQVPAYFRYPECKFAAYNFIKIKILSLKAFEIQIFNFNRFNMQHFYSAIDFTVIEANVSLSDRNFYSGYKRLINGGRSLQNSCQRVNFL